MSQKHHKVINIGASYELVFSLRRSTKTASLCYFLVLPPNIVKLIADVSHMGAIVVIINRSSCLYVMMNGKHEVDSAYIQCWNACTGEGVTAMC